MNVVSYGKVGMRHLRYPMLRRLSVQILAKLKEPGMICGKD
jgi:hypothetical protein